MAEPITEPMVDTPTEKTFTQSEVDALITRRVARAMKGMPSAEELEAYNNWKASQQTEQEKFNVLTKERDTLSGQLATANAELEQLKREKYLLGKGVSGEDAEFMAFKAAKLISDDKTFEQAVDELMQNRQPEVVIKTGGELGGGGGAKSASEQFNAIIRGARNR